MTAEAMPASRLLVATRVGGIPKVVRDGENKFLVPPRSPDSIAERLIQLLFLLMAENPG
jgi:glycosyltransferase involved in cell wall biosynthesis